MKSDIDIAQAAKLEKITSIAKKLDIPEKSLEPYGHYKAKISLDFIENCNPDAGIPPVKLKLIGFSHTATPSVRAKNVKWLTKRLAG